MAIQLDYFKIFLILERRYVCFEPIRVSKVYQLYTYLLRSEITAKISWCEQWSQIVYTFHWSKLFLCPNLVRVKVVCVGSLTTTQRIRSEHPKSIKKSGIDSSEKSFPTISSLEVWSVIVHALVQRGPINDLAFHCSILNSAFRAFPTEIWCA